MLLLEGKWKWVKGKSWQLYQIALNEISRLSWVKFDKATGKPSFYNCRERKWGRQRREKESDERREKSGKEEEEGEQEVEGKKKTKKKSAICKFFVELN